MGITVEQVQKAANNIGQLDPRPGQVFAEAPQNYVLPDVTVEKIQGEYQVILNGEQIPHLRISNTYKDIMVRPPSAWVWARESRAARCRSGGHATRVRGLAADALHG